MKSLEEIQKILVSEVQNNVHKLAPNLHIDYYNEILGDTSFLIAGFLEKQLKKKNINWDNRKWIDDSLITRAKYANNKIMLWGIIIEGFQNTTKQWTDPFYCEFELNKDVKTSPYLFLFGDSENSEIEYKDFNNRRNFWDKDFYSNSEWNPSERDWKYTFNG